MTIEENNMTVERCIRAYHKQTGTVAFDIKLPSDCLTFLSMVDFLIDDNDDPLLYYSYELTKDQTDYLLGHWHLLHQAATDYFDYFLECDSVTKVKTKEELFLAINQDCIDFIRDIIGKDDSSMGIPAAYRQDFWELHELLYKIYLQGVSDGRI